MLELPPSCIQCGLWQNCSTWKIPSRIDTRRDGRIQDEWVLVLGQAPGYYEDQQGKPFVGPSGKFLQKYLDELECKWVLENALKCYPGRDPRGKGDNKPSREQQDLCAAFCFETITKFKPKVIVCLGKVAMQTVLGKEAPKTLRAALAPRQLDDGTWVVCVEHPANHVSGRQDLRERYFTVFSQVERLALGIGEDIPFTWEIINSTEYAWQIALGALKSDFADEIYFDVETGQSSNDIAKLTHWHPDACLVSVSVTVQMAPEKYHSYVFMGEALDPEIWKELLRDKVVWAHNTKFDMSVLWRFMGFNPYKVVRRWEDTFGWFYLRNQSRPGNSLKNLAQVHLGAMPWSDAVWRRVDEINKLTAQENKIAKKEGLPLNNYIADFRDVEPHLLAEYNARDTFWTARLAVEKVPEIKEEVSSIAYQLFRDATYSLARLERHGLPVNTYRLQKLQDVVNNKIKALRTMLSTQPEVLQVLNGFAKRAYTFLPGDDVKNGWHVYDPAPLNVKSFKFMERLAECLEHHTGEKTEKAGRLRFNTDVLKYLGGLYPPVSDDEKSRAQWIYYYLYHIRQNRDLSSKFLKNLREYTVEGRIHTTYRIGKVESLGRTAGGDLEGGAETGRLSSSNPNLQNVKKDPVLRSCFCAPKGYYLAEADYDRIELVVLAELSGDSALTEDVAPGGDPHTAMGQTIAQILDISYTDEVRDLAKRVNFGKIYGQTPEALAQMTGVNLLEAVKIHQSFDNRYHGVAQYFADIRQAVEDEKYITTPFGRRRHFPLTGNPGIDGHAYRQACNYPIQSVASDITLWKLTEVFAYYDKASEYGDPGFHPFNIVHDSHWHEIVKELYPDIKADLTDIMQNMSTLPIKFERPLTVSWKIGEHLGDMKKDE